VSLPKIKTVVPWFGSARTVAERIGEHLTGFKWVGIPFCGGLSEVLYIQARSIVCNDMHRHMINLAQVLKDATLGPAMIESLRDELFHPETLAHAQATSADTDNDQLIPMGARALNYEAARQYFIACWMGRSGNAGGDREFTGNLSVRWNANGGDSNTRYRSAVESLAAWRKVIQRCNFTCMDCFEFLETCEDDPEHAIYCDPPWPEDGDVYRHKFTREHHTRLAQILTRFQNARVVVRINTCSLVDELYPRGLWNWNQQTSRTQGNNDKVEVILVYRPRRKIQRV